MTRQRGGYRVRRYIIPGPVPVWVSSGRWGLTHNHDIVQFMIKNGADLRLRGTVSGAKGTKSFTGLELAAKRKDPRMVDILKRAGPLRQ